MTKFNDIFTIAYGQKEYNSKKHLAEKIGTVPLISSKGTNFGIFGFYNIEPKYKHVISVPRTGTICYAVYQKNNCCIDDNCLVLTPKVPITENEMIYYSLLIRNERYKYMYGRQVTPKRLGETPVPTELPKWVNEYKVNELENFDLSITKRNINLDVSKWRSFTLNELFHISSGKGPSINEAKRRKGNLPLITATEKNNGISVYTHYNPTHSPNVITVAKNGSIGEAFYQDLPFCASSDVAVLEPKFQLNPYLAFFFITLIKKEKYRFNYGLKWNLNRMNESIIKLPIDQFGKPDWHWIEQYVKTLRYSRNL
jgi:restriction endonuclease S subunit